MLSLLASLLGLRRSDDTDAMSRFRQMRGRQESYAEAPDLEGELLRLARPKAITLGYARSSMYHRNMMNNHWTDRPYSGIGIEESR
jgi:hypothetical protein